MLTLNAVALALIREIEERAFHAWPAVEVVEVCGWRLRFNQSVTGRANSVWPNADDGELSLREKLDRVEAAYAARDLPPKFQVSPVSQPEGLNSALDERGYVPPQAVTYVGFASVDGVLERLPPGGVIVRVSEQISQEWFAAYAGAEAYSATEQPIRRGIIERISTRCGFALAEQDGEPASVALGVLAGDWLGLFCVATRPEFRRRGLARATLRTLLEWGAANGAERTYLQVMENNAPARRLYAEAGYAGLYRYHYRTRMQAPGISS